MTKKRFLEGDFFEGYSLVGIVCGLPDFRTAYFINKQTGIWLKKHHNFSLTPMENPPFSWFYFHHEEMRRTYFLIQNKSDGHILMPELRNFDYLLLLYGNISESYQDEFLSTLRKTPHITAAFLQDLHKLKNADLLIEQNEKHTPASKRQ